MENLINVTRNEDETINIAIDCNPVELIAITVDILEDMVAQLDENDFLKGMILDMVNDAFGE